MSENLLCVTLGPHLTLGLLELQSVGAVRPLVVKYAICTGRPVQGSATKARRNYAFSERAEGLASVTSLNLLSSTVQQSRGDSLSVFDRSFDGLAILKFPLKGSNNVKHGSNLLVELGYLQLADGLQPCGIVLGWWYVSRMIRDVWEASDLQADADKRFWPLAGRQQYVSPPQRCRWPASCQLVCFDQISRFDTQKKRH